MFNKLCGLAIIAALFIVVGEVKSQSGLPTDPAAIESLYMNLSLRQLGVPNPLNDPFFFSSPNAPAGYLGLCSLTNTDAVMQNLDVILQHTQINTGGSTFDPVFGMRYTNGTVANAYTNATATESTVNVTGALPLPPAETINLTSSAVVQAGTLCIGSGGTTMYHSLLLDTLTLRESLTKVGAGTLTLTGENSYTGDTTVTAGTVDFSGGSACTVFSGGVLEASKINIYNPEALQYTGTISLTGANTAMVLANTNAGTLHIEGGDAVLVNSGTVSLNGGATLSTIPWGTSTLTGLAGTLTLAGNGTIDRGFTLAPNPDAGTVTLQGGALQLNSAIDVSGISDLAITPIVSGTGLVKIGSGTLTLNGTLNYTGTTTVNEDTLSFNNGGISPIVFTGGGATLNASSIVADTLSINPSPFASPGTVVLARNGSFILNPDGVASTASVVPEPGTLLLLMSGLSILFLARRSRRAI
jgi:fibronectin-binding autotransporter adhesin